MLVNKCCEKSQWQSLWKYTTSEGWQHIWEDSPNLKQHWDQLMATSFEDSTPINHDRSQVAPRHRKGRGHVWVAWAAHQDEVPVPSVSWKKWTSREWVELSCIVFRFLFKRFGMGKRSGIHNHWIQILQKRSSLYFWLQRSYFQKWYRNYIRSKLNMGSHLVFPSAEKSKGNMTGYKRNTVHLEIEVLLSG